MWIPRYVEVFVSCKAAPIKKNKDLKWLQCETFKDRIWAQRRWSVKSVKDGEEAKAAALKEEATCWENNITSALSHIWPRWGRVSQFPLGCGDSVCLELCLRVEVWTIASCAWAALRRGFVILLLLTSSKGFRHYFIQADTKTPTRTTVVNYKYHHCVWNSTLYVKRGAVFGVDSPAVPRRLALPTSPRVDLLSCN